MEIGCKVNIFLSNNHSICAIIARECKKTKDTCSVSAGAFSFLFGTWSYFQITILRLPTLPSLSYALTKIMPGQMSSNEMVSTPAPDDLSNVPFMP